ncbi:MAG TPA: rRNA maturation RNase YbeY [Acidiferrobacter sp.]|nr:rRNA maturation RNase YbeY [Acidiferrobacter sp.]
MLPRLYLDVEVACAGCTPPQRSILARWAKAAVADMSGSLRLGLRIVDEAEGASLNARFRGRAGPTNVLSFPYEERDHGKTQFLGDIVICAPIMAAEALAAGRPEKAHWAHLWIHGILHLRGFDHHTDQDARIMERREAQVLQSLGFTDPYR